jgi:hypothetical protein
MSPYYKMAIKDLPSQYPKRSYWADVIENLAGHVMLGFIHNFDKNKPPLYRLFFEKANAQQRGLAIRFIERSFVMKGGPTKLKKCNYFGNGVLKKQMTLKN